MIAELIYTLCSVTSLFCFALLWRGYRRTRMPLLLWSSGAFFAFTVANVLLILDLVLFPSVDLSLYRSGVTFAGVLVLLVGILFTT